MFCSKCGKPVNDGASFCSACGTQVTSARESDPVTPNSIATAPATSLDISWGVVAGNFLVMMVVAYMTYPIPSELKSSGAPIYLLIRVGVPAFFAAIVTTIFYTFRKKTEARLLKRSFVITAWVFLGLVVLGGRS